MSAADAGNVTAAVTAGAAKASGAIGLTKIGMDFLSRVVAWPVKNVGYVSFHWSTPDRKKGDNHTFIPAGKPFQDKVAFFSHVEWALTTKSHRDFYFCLSTQSTATVNNQGKVKAVKQQSNALYVKSIWLDVDVKPDKPEKNYTTQIEAWNAITAFRVAAGLPQFSAVISSGGGFHIYWISDRVLTPDQWRPYAEGLKSLAIKHGLKFDAGLTTDSARVLRVPDTFNYKTDPPKPVKLLHLSSKDYDFANSGLNVLPNLAPATVTTSAQATTHQFYDPQVFAGKKPIFTASDKLSDGISKYENTPPLPVEPVVRDCAFIRDALATGGKDYSQPMWNLTTLAATFLEEGHALAHKMGNQHPGYSVESTDALWDRKLRERADRGLGWPSCAAIQASGCGSCVGCPHLAASKSPLNLAYQKPSPAELIPPSEPSFVDPYAQFVGPEFPLDLLPPTLANFVDAEHRAMGADPAAIAMAALTAVAGAMNAETQVRMGESWWEKPILWTVLVGQPSSMKSPILDKVHKPLSDIDHERSKRFSQAHKKWLQDKKIDKTIAGPVKQPRCLINDATPEKVAEILSRDPSGSLMVRDELAGWLGSFERYNSGSSRAFFLSCWNGGTFTKDRVGSGRQDADAEICVDNLALGILGGIQPDLLSKLGDLTSDGLLQRFLIVLMKCAERGDQDQPVAGAEAEYEKLIRSINGAQPQNYHFADDALEVRDRVLDYLHKLEMVDGFSSSLIGAIGKLKGYFARICLVLHVGQRHDAMIGNAGRAEPLPPSFTAAAGESLRKLFSLSPSDCLSAGIAVSSAISRETAESVEKILRDFLLPHTFGFYDVVVNGGQERDKLRTIANFILASDKDRLRPSDFTAGVRILKGEPEHKIREWVGRFCGMDWLVAEDGKGGAPPKAWQVVPGLRGHFAERRKQSQAARAEAHAILKAGGSRRKPP